MTSAFQPWIGQAVIIQVAQGRFKISLRGLLLKDGMDTLFVRADDGPELRIPKAVVLAIEEGHCSSASHLVAASEQNPTSLLKTEFHATQ